MACWSSPRTEQYHLCSTSVFDRPSSSPWFSDPQTTNGTARQRRRSCPAVPLRARGRHVLPLPRWETSMGIGWGNPDVRAHEHTPGNSFTPASPRLVHRSQHGTGEPANRLGPVSVRPPCPATVQEWEGPVSPSTRSAAPREERAPALCRHRSCRDELFHSAISKSRARSLIRSISVQASYSSKNRFCWCGKSSSVIRR